MDDITEEMTIVNPLGMHARPAAALVQTVLQFASDVHLQMNGHKVNAKSIMGLLTLEGNHGAKLRLHATGEGAAEALDVLADLFAQKFFED